LASIGSVIQKNLANNDKVAAAREVSGAYVRHSLGITQQTWDKASGSEREGYWMSAMKGCIM
jgi:hypothetical protein